MKKLLSALLSFTTLFTFTIADLPQDYADVPDNSSASEFVPILMDGDYVVPFSTDYPVPEVFLDFDQGGGNYLIPIDISDYSLSNTIKASYFVDYLNRVYSDECAFIIYFTDSSNTSFSLFIYDKSCTSINYLSRSHLVNSSQVSCKEYCLVSDDVIAPAKFSFDSSTSSFILTGLNAPAKTSGYSLYCYTTATCSSSSPLYNGRQGQLNRRFFFSDSTIAPSALKLFDASSVRFYDVNSSDSSLYTLTINYLYSEDNPAADPVVKELSPGDEYNISSPEIEGYSPSIPIVTGIMPEEDLTIDVYYTKGFYPLTVKYQYQDGSQAADDVTLQYPFGFIYDIPSPKIEGYFPDKPSVTGTMPNGAWSEVVTYNPNLYDLRIDYRHQDGTQAAETHLEQLVLGAAYSITSPTLPGYKPDQEVINGTMPAKDVYFTVTYKPDPGGGSTGGGSSGDGDNEGDGDDDGDDDSGGTGSGGGWTGNDPFIPNQPPFSGYDPFDMSGGFPGWSGYDPFSDPFHWGLPSYTYDPFVMPGGE